MLTIGVRYCGGCNPQIDRSRIVMELREGLKKMGREVDLITDRDKSVDVVLLVNGCQHACLEGENLESGRGQHMISVRGEMVDDQYVEGGDIANILIQRICSFL
jgi:4-hydroxybutyrate CoA-transferase